MALMCGRYSLFSPMDAIGELFDIVDMPADPLGLLAPRYNIAPTQQVAIIRAADAGRRLDLVRWGLVPAWRQTPSDGPPCINARSESVASKPSFSAAFNRRRCLVPANGFYEWRTEGKQKQPFFFHVDQMMPLCFAGLWEEWSGGENENLDHLTSTAIITTNANPIVQPVHPRMPVILAPTSFDAWLDPNNDTRTALALLAQTEASGLLLARPVSRRINKTANEGAELIEPVDPQGSASSAPASDDTQLDLF